MSVLYQGSLAAALAGQRLEQVVQQLVPLSRREARLAIARGQVELGGKLCRILARAVKAGQRLVVNAPVDAAAALSGTGQPAAAPPPPSLAILYLDRHVVAVNKPALLLSERDRFGAPSVESVLPGLLAAQGERSELWLVHRLDAGTSGVLLLARTRSAARAVSAALRARQVHKVYWALCAGELAGPTSVAAPLARKSGCQQGVVAPDHPQAKAATTHVRPLGRAPGATWVEARPITGRSHQIRVHLAHLGHPIEGDGLYGGPRYLPAQPGNAQRLSLARPMLHAHLLRLAHPNKPEQALQVRAPAPADFLLTAERLGLLGQPGAT